MARTGGGGTEARLADRPAAVSHQQVAQLDQPIPGVWWRGRGGGGLRLGWLTGRQPSAISRRPSWISRYPECGGADGGGD